MEVTKELRELYLAYFKSEDDFKKHLVFVKCIQDNCL